MTDPNVADNAESAPAKNIHQRILAAQADIDGYIQKDKTVRAGAGEYKAVSHDAVTAHIRDAMIKHGIVPRVTIMGAKHELIETTNQRGEKRNLSRCNLWVAVDFVNADNPADTMHADAEGLGDDYGDKGPGKAYSYAVKAVYLKTFLLETGEDEESRSTRAALEEPIDAARAEWIRASLKTLEAPPDSVLAYLNQRFPDAVASEIEQIPLKQFRMVELALNKRLAQHENEAGAP